MTMNNSRRFYLTSLAVLLLFSGFYWLLPIPGHIAYIPDQRQDIWPQVTVLNRENGRFEVVVRDTTPWVHVRLEAAGVNTSLESYGTQDMAGVWQWRWLVAGNPTAGLELYHSCDSGCRRWTAVQMGATAVTQPTSDLIPTKLGVVFANPERNWHNRQGWAVEITYAQRAELEFWGIDDLAQRVEQAQQNGLRVLVRVEYDQGQNIPPPADYAALDTYLRYVRRLARDERLAAVHGFIIGSNFNSAGANAQSAANPVTPEWYARIFNGYGLDPAQRDNALAVIRSENRQAHVIVGPVSPWNSDQSGAVVYTIDVPWLNYMNTLVAHLNTSAQAKAAQGISDGAPDGFAVQAFGRVDVPELLPGQRPQEPFFDLHRPEWGQAQMGFRVYRDWLNIINSYDHTAGKPVYISAANTFDRDNGRTPAENYPAGWLTNALTAVNQEPQIAALCWFIDTFPHDEQWAMFSLTAPRGLLLEGAQEFDELLGE
jgi:hypothetical protein